MKFDHIVKYNGEYYEAGQEVPMEESPAFSDEEEMPFSDEDIGFENAPHRYTEDELSGMTVKDIRRLAEDMGITLKKTAREDVVNEFLEKQWQ